MEIYYNSENFCVFEFSNFGTEYQHLQGGFEIVNKRMSVGTFIYGANASEFRTNIDKMKGRIIAPSLDEVDEFLENYSGLMLQPTSMH